MKRSHIQYPHHLYPNRRYKLITLDQWMNDNMYVIRFTDDGKPVPDLETLRNSIAYYFNKDHWFEGMSVSLCGPFRKNDVCYVIKKYKMKSYSKPWKTGKRVRLIKPKHVLFTPNRGYFGLKIGDVTNVRFNYNFEYKVDNNKKKRTDQCHLILSHAPTRSNFWHFNIWIESHNIVDDVFFTNEVVTGKLPSKRNMSKRAEASFMLLQNIVCMPEQTQEVMLPQNYYV